MLELDPQTLLRIALVLAGGFAYLYIVANEKHRRERWLAFRLENKLKQAGQDGSDLSHP